MKKLCFIAALLLCFSLCACGSSTPKSAELTEKYDFYKTSISGLKTATGVTAEEADEIFISLVSDCGVDSWFTVTKNSSGGFYNVNYGMNTLKMYLDGSTISEVFDGESQIYPAVTSDASTSQESSAPEETEAPADSAPDNSPIVFDFSASDIPFGEVDTGALEIQHGELLSVIYNDGVVVVKAKIQPNLTNNLTVEQNYFNVGDLIKNHGFNTCEELQYWAVADMTSGEEVKVISFDLDKDTINNLYNEKIFENQLEDYVDNLFIHISLKE